MSYDKGKVKPTEAGSLKEGSYVIIDGEPCKVVEIEKSKTGKHGSAKVLSLIHI